MGEGGWAEVSGGTLCIVTHALARGCTAPLLAGISCSEGWKRVKFGVVKGGGGGCR